MLQHGGWKKQLVIGQEFEIPETGTDQGTNNHRPPKEARIWFLEFSGDLDFDVTSKRRRHFDKIRMVEGHDTAPPPPDPGGEEGDGEEE